MNSAAALTTRQVGGWSLVLLAIAYLLQCRLRIARACPPGRDRVGWTVGVGAKQPRSALGRGIRTAAAAVARAGVTVVRILGIAARRRVGTLHVPLTTVMPVRNALRRGLRERADRRNSDHRRCQNSLRLC